MQIVIDIPDEDKGYIDRVVGNYFLAAPTVDVILNAVKNGTPLPKGHGRLIDVIELKAKMFGLPKNNNRAYWDGVDAVGDLIDNAPIIIEADKGGVDCDLCKENLPDAKIKYKYRAKYVWRSWHEGVWNKLELCQECLDKIITAVEADKEKEKENGNNK